MNKQRVVQSAAAVELGATVGTFDIRMKRKLEAQKAEESRTEKEANAREARILSAMTIIRKALQEASRITMGERFHLAIVISDNDGWPKLEVRLIDRLAPQRIDYGLVIGVNDHLSTGLIQFKLRNGETLGELTMANPSEMARLAVVLKGSIRRFLDIVGGYVLKPRKPEELVEVTARPIGTHTYETSAPLSKSSLDHSLLGAELFSEEIEPENENKVAEVDDVNPLAGL